MRMILLCLTLGLTTACAPTQLPEDFNADFAF